MTKHAASRGALTAALMVAALLAPGPAAAQTVRAAAAPYTDVSASSYASEAVAALAQMGVFAGTDCGDGQFCPRSPLPRWAMAVWMVRILDSGEPTASASRFADVTDDPWWQSHVERLADMRVTVGCGREPLRFCPQGSVTRGQTASFLTRAFGLAPAQPAGFSDTAGSVFAADIDSLAAAGVTVGCGREPRRYCTAQTATRAQMAVFLHRAMTRDTGPLTATLQSAAPLVTGGSFDAEIRFSAPVRSLRAQDLIVANGTVSRIYGGGARYVARIDPASAGAVMVRVPAAAAATAHGDTNSPSAPLIRVFSQRPPDLASAWLDTWNRESVAVSAQEEFQRHLPERGYTGDVDSCVAGTTSEEFRASVIQRVNWYRSMAGVGPVTENPEHSAGAQQTALMLLAQGDLAHDPPPHWACYSDAAAAYAPANLALGTAGTVAVDAYMRDDGDNNTAVGHRRWMLLPQTQQMGTGDAWTRRWSANALWHNDGNRSSRRPAVREQRGFVAWPPSGYVPAAQLWGRWSFSLPGADFSAADVAMRDDEGPLTAEIIDRATPTGEPALVWAAYGDADSQPLPLPDGDRCFVVTITGVAAHGEPQDPYEYAVCALDPDSPRGPSVSLAVAAGTPQPVTDTFNVHATFSESVAGFSTDDVFVVNGTLLGLAGNGDSYLLTVRASDDGPVAVTVAEAAVHDASARAGGRSTALIVDADVTRPAAALTSDTPATLRGEFAVSVSFDEAVVGLSLGGLSVVNGTVTTLRGTGADYQAQIVPTELGAVVVTVAAGSAVNAAGRANTASAPLTRINTPRPRRTRPGTDMWDQAAAVSAYERYKLLRQPAPSFTGNVEQCLAGSVDSGYRAVVIGRINWYRSIAGLAPISESSGLRAEAQHAALLFAASGNFDASPDAACYSAEAASAAVQPKLSRLSRR